jgi:hypothetical protein
MKPAKKRLCLCCISPLEADYRNAYHQEYCSKPSCRKASKAASQRLWLAKPENVNYHSGPVAVARVSDWQKAHPECRERQKIKRQAALQDFCPAQPVESTHELPIPPSPEEICVLPATPALQDFIITQPFVFVGLIAHFFNLTLQDDIASTTRSLQKLGEDIANGRGQDEFFKTGDLFGAHAASAGAVQLGGSALGAG